MSVLPSTSDADCPETADMTRFALLALALALLAGCGVVSGAASVVGAAVSVTTTAVGTAVDVVTSPVR